MIALAQQPSVAIRAFRSMRLDMSGTDEDRAYYLRRIARCSELAAQATCPSARRAHLKLARLYREKLEAPAATLHQQAPSVRNVARKHARAFEVQG